MTSELNIRKLSWTEGLEKIRLILQLDYGKGQIYEDSLIEIGSDNIPFLFYDTYQNLASHIISTNQLVRSSEFHKVADDEIIAGSLRWIMKSSISRQVL
mgnify:CR=1 FL=1